MAAGLRQAAGGLAAVGSAAAGLHRAAAGSAALSDRTDQVSTGTLKFALTSREHGSLHGSLTLKTGLRPRVGTYEARAGPWALAAAARVGPWVAAARAGPWRAAAMRH